MAQTKLSTWLEKKYIDWIAQTGHRRTVTEFAKWLGISRPLLSGYMNGSRQPSRENTDLLAAKLGAEIYDLLGYQRPDLLLKRLQNNWDDLNDEERNQIEQIVNGLESRQNKRNLK